ncbi:uncharacterized protein DDB_G0290685-like [Vigna umbellata]|uniref:uncharacterized protein DDB_G0290685-like n=1 Tax=Vigna umbellata TaxID=87088 RepID=UPI001F5ED72B|nr:uncharacterized protein DDB_G0290685-like [Vigna umbellata]
MGLPTEAPTSPRVSIKGSCSVVKPIEYSGQYELLVDGDSPRIMAVRQFICPHKQLMHQPVIDEDDDLAEAEDDPLAKLMTKLPRLNRGPVEVYWDNRGSDNDNGDNNNDASGGSGDESGGSDKESGDNSNESIDNESSNNNARGETRRDDYDMCALRHRGREISREDESGGREKGSDNDNGDNNNDASGGSGDESGGSDKESGDNSNESIDNESSNNNARGETRRDDYDMCALRHRGREISREDESGGREKDDVRKVNVSLDRCNLVYESCLED